METVPFLCVLLCIVTVGLLPLTSAQSGREPYSFEDIFNSTLRPRSFSPRWVHEEDKFYYRSIDDGNVYLYNAVDDTKTILVTKAQFENAGSLGTYFMSSDLTHVLFAYETQSLWRHSFNAKYKILNLASGGQWNEFPHGPLAGKVLEYAQWSPSNLALSFVYGNNLYYQANPSTDPVRLTADGDPLDIFNGVPDWLYEEDVLSDRVSHYWSPDSKYICYARLNDTEVPSISWPLYGDKSDVFGSTREIKYPKAGDVRDGKAGPNTLVDLFVVDVATPNAIKLPPPTELADQEHYYLQVAWVNETFVHVVWANRVQNHSSSAYYDVTSNTPQPIPGLVYDVTGGWVEVPPPMPWFYEGLNYLTIHPQPVTDTGNWRHLAVYSQDTGKVQFLTDGQEEIDFIYGYDPVGKYVYYSSTNGDATERDRKSVV